MGVTSEFSSQSASVATDLSSAIDSDSREAWAYAEELAGDSNAQAVMNAAADVVYRLFCRTNVWAAVQAVASSMLEMGIVPGWHVHDLCVLHGIGQLPVNELFGPLAGSF